MRLRKKTIKGGLYLVVNPALNEDILLEKVQAALSGRIDIVQIWNNWPMEGKKVDIIEAIARLCKPYSIPVLINEEWPLLLKTKDLHGVHFDRLPDELASIRKIVGRPILTGLTCTGDLKTVQLANKNQIDYISFCSMFPSASAGSCSIVLPETVQRASTLTNLPIFISGGITPENTALLKKKIPFSGVAVISGILSSENPKMEAEAYQLALNTKK
ncbi:thiamine phosphate synthase [Pedobacter sp.]|uniref:thiamine phosphate synthase n=1 Tax=Pedobacter sp. TaxID=1411316 RepID=UPI0010D166EC|nr:MAG: thiamine phosphate synthase [Sphingobacteriales bacterium]